MVNLSHPEILTIKNVTKDNAGWYGCLISNPLGRYYQTAWLTVLGKGLDKNEKCFSPRNNAS